MPSVTTWNRIEPRVRGDSLSSIDARVHDPLWLLGRQWQVGEFRGEDAGSPIAVRIAAKTGTLSRYRAATGNGSATDYEPAAAPLEAVAEGEAPVRAAEPDIRLRAEAGRAFLREFERARL